MRHVETLKFGDQIIVKGLITAGLVIEKLEGRRVAIEGSPEDLQHVAIARSGGGGVCLGDRQAAGLNPPWCSASDAPTG